MPELNSAMAPKSKERIAAVLIPNELFGNPQTAYVKARHLKLVDSVDKGISENIHKQAMSITRDDRERMNSQKGQVIWFTGLSGSGKSTLANALEVALHAQGKRTYILDGDNVRQGLNKDLGFTAADRVENIRRIAEVAKLMMDAGLIVLTAFISPFKEDREMAKSLIGKENYFEVHVNTSLAVCEERDTKGLYKKARCGQLPNMTGIDSPYEAPTNPAVSLDCGIKPLEQVLDELLGELSL